MSISFITFLVAGILFVVMSIPLIKRKIKINHWYGIRLPQTMTDENIWYEVNEIMGKYLLIFGIIVVILSLVLFLMPMVSELTAVIIISIFLLIGSIRIAMLAMKLSSNLSKIFHEVD